MARRIRLMATALALVVGLALIAAGASALFLGNDQPKLVVATPPPTITHTPRPATPTPVNTATPAPTPTPSNAPIERIIIEKINVDAPVVVKGVAPNGVMEIPDTPYDVAWYNFTGYPGHGSNAVFSGHVDWYPNIIGVFWGLRDLAEGDIIKVRLTDGTEYTYKVTKNWLVDADNAPVEDIVGPTDKEVVTLITCDGQFVRDARGYGSYLGRRIVRAERITEEAAPALGSGGLGSQ